MNSIRMRLLLAITAASLILSTATGIWLYHVLGEDLEKQFDRSLQIKAHAISSLLTLDAKGRMDFEYIAASLPEYEPGRRAEYFVILDPAGHVFTRSRSLDRATLTLPPRDLRLSDLKLPDGRAGRAFQTNFEPQPDIAEGRRARAEEQEPEDEAARTADVGTAGKATAAASPGATTMPSPAGRRMTVVVARDRSELDRALRTLLRALVLATVTLACATAASAFLIVQSALRPVNIVADHCARIDATRLSLRLPEEGLPLELKPICTRLNDLLSRLNSAFTRERRFTADAAHELRTPIAELRSITEVALKWPDDSESCVRGLREALDIAEQMETLVTTLLSLARSGDQEARVLLQPVSLHDLVIQSVRVLEKPIGARAVEIEVPADAFVMAEPSLLTSVLTNLLANAGEYARGDAAIRCIATRRAGDWTFSIENPCAMLEGGDLNHLFEPFWRRDHSRTDGGHAGLGLALVAAYCRLMHVQCEATQPKPDALRITLQFAAAPAGANVLASAMS